MNDAQARKLLRNLELVFYNINRGRDWLERQEAECEYMLKQLREIEKELVDVQREARKLVKR